MELLLLARLDSWARQSRGRRMRRNRTARGPADGVESGVAWWLAGGEEAGRRPRKMQAVVGCGAALQGVGGRQRRLNRTFRRRWGSSAGRWPTATQAPSRRRARRRSLARVGGRKVVRWAS